MDQFSGNIDMESAYGPFCQSCHDLSRDLSKIRAERDMLEEREHRHDSEISALRRTIDRLLSVAEAVGPDPETPWQEGANYTWDEVAFIITQEMEEYRNEYLREAELIDDQNNNGRQER